MPLASGCFSWLGGLACTVRRRLGQLMLCSLLVMLAACTGNVELLSDISDGESNEVLAVLLDAGLSARKQPGKEGVAILVPADEVGRALDTLRGTGLPRERFAGMGQIFRKEGLVSSPLEERARYLYALSQELSNTLTQLDGVLVARVHVVLPERGNIGETTMPSTAAVFIKHRRDYTLDALQPQIRRLVTHSIPGLSESQVTVVLIPSDPVSTSRRDSSTSSAPGDAGLASALAGNHPALPWLVLTLAALLAISLAIAAWALVQRRKGLAA